MTNDAILAALDAQISKLQEVRAMLSGSPTGPPKRKLGRPKGAKSVAPAKAVKIAPVKARKGTMTAEGKARIAAAQKLRWARAKKKQRKV